MLPFRALHVLNVIDLLLLTISQKDYINVWICNICELRSEQLYLKLRGTPRFPPFWNLDLLGLFIEFRISRFFLSLFLSSIFIILRSSISILWHQERKYYPTIVMTDGVVVLFRNCRGPLSFQRFPPSRTVRYARVYFGYMLSHSSHYTGCLRMGLPLSLFISLFIFSLGERTTVRDRRTKLTRHSRRLS